MSKVYFSRDLSPETLIKLYDAVGINLPGNIAIKVHSGEKGNQNFIHPEFFKPMADYVKTNTIVECNTAYDGERNYSDKHRKLFDEHEWTKYFNVDLLDEDGYDEIAIENGNILTKNLVGKNLKNYDSLLVLSHFKGHPMGGFGGALKQLSIGCASTEGKCYIHSAGKTIDQDNIWSNVAEQSDFCECMADAAKSVIDIFGGNAVYISAAVNLSVDCDCCAIAEDPCMADIGIFASADPVALDMACLDAVYASSDPGKDHLIKRIEERLGKHTIDAAAKIGAGSTDYELIEI